MKQKEDDKKPVYDSPKMESNYFVKVQFVKSKMICRKKTYGTPKNKRPNHNSNFLFLNQKSDEEKNKYDEDEDKEFYDKILNSLINKNDSNSKIHNRSNTLKNSRNNSPKSNRDKNISERGSNFCHEKNLFKNTKKIDIFNLNKKQNSAKNVQFMNSMASKVDKMSLSPKKNSNNKPDSVRKNDNRFLCLSNNQMGNLNSTSNQRDVIAMKSNKKNKFQKSFDVSPYVAELKMSQINKQLQNKNNISNENLQGLANNTNDNNIKTKKCFTICCIPFRRRKTAQTNNINNQVMSLNKNE